MFKILIFCLTLVSAISAENKKFDFEAKTAIFFPKSHNFNNVYENPLPSYQLEGSLLFKNRYKWWNNFSYLTKKGKSDPLNVPTFLKIFSLSSGVKYNFFKSNNQNLSFGIGAVYSWLEEKNRAYFAKRIKRKNGIGGIIKLEFSKFFDSLVFSLFSDYQIQYFSAGTSLEGIKVNISGIYLGAAIGFRY